MTRQQVVAKDNMGKSRLELIAPRMLLYHSGRSYKVVVNGYTVYSNIPGVQILLSNYGDKMFALCFVLFWNWTTTYRWVIKMTNGIATQGMSHSYRQPFTSVIIQSYIVIWLLEVLSASPEMESLLRCL